MALRRYAQIIGVEWAPCWHSAAFAGPRPRHCRIAGIILITNMQTFLETVGVSGTPATVIYLLIAGVSLSALAFAIFVTRQEEEPQVAHEGDVA